MAEKAGARGEKSEMLVDFMADIADCLPIKQSGKIKDDCIGPDVDRDKEKAEGEAERSLIPA